MISAVDSDWPDDVETRRSVSGGLLTLYGVPIGSAARMQAIPASSSCQAEQCAIGSGWDLGEHPHWFVICETDDSATRSGTIQLRKLDERSSHVHSCATPVVACR